MRKDKFWRTLIGCGLLAAVMGWLFFFEGLAFGQFLKWTMIASIAATLYSMVVIYKYLKS